MQKYRRELGGVGLAICILLPTILLVFNVVLTGAQNRVDELDYWRTCRAHLEIAKASYDRKLWREYGLWGVRQEQITDSLPMQLAEDATNPAISVDRPLFATAELHRQIQKHMDLRAEILLTEDVINRYQVWSAKSPGSLQSELADALGTIDTSDPRKLIENPPPPADWPVEKNEEGEEVPVSTEGIDYSRALSPVSDLLEECYTAILPVYNAAAIGIGDNPLAPSGLLSIAAVVDDLLDNSGFVPEKLALQEYVLNYFTSAVEDDAHRQISTPYGKLHSDLIKQGRLGEVEQVITGIFDGPKAADRILNYLRMICFSANLLENLSDASVRAKYLGIATSISVSVGVLSAGTVLIPPTTLQYLLIVVNSLREGLRQARLLKQGKAVALGLYGKHIDLYYRDFLRIFLLVKRQENILINLPEIINQVVPGTFYTAFEVRGNYADRHLVLTGNFGEK